MAVISLTLTQSETETVPGIPDFITIESNIPAIIFFTFNGTTPDTSSSVYLGPITLPQQNFTLSIFATNGQDNSAIVVQSFAVDPTRVINVYSGDARIAQSTTNDNAFTLASSNSLYPYGTFPNNTNSEYTGVGNPSQTVYDESNPNKISNAFDADGNPASFSNAPLDPFNTRPIDQKVKPIGKLGPTENTQEISSSADKLFNPKALVVYHDGDNLDPLTPQIINRSQFSLENPEIYKNGLLLSAGAGNTPTSTGSFVKSFYNERTGKITNYYRDAQTNRWIISSFKYTPTAQPSTNFGRLVFGRQEGSQYVYQWHLWARRTIM